jgi:cyclophilin family peptidyl-prolyl cis-trans isomerase
MKHITIVFSLLLFVGCSEKKEYTPIDPTKVREQLMAYGDKNPENEVLIETEFGAIRVRLYDDTPLHRANFIKNIKEGVYDDATFYRVISQFMVQAGIYPRELGYTIPAEITPKYIHKKGALAMARSDEDNPDYESSSSEFFIVQGSRYADYQVETDMENFGLQLTPEQKETYMTAGGYMSLDQRYTTFGEVIEGLEVIDKIAAVKTHDGDKPLRPINVTVRIAEKG